MEFNLEKEAEKEMKKTEKLVKEQERIYMKEQQKLQKEMTWHWKKKENCWPDGLSREQKDIPHLTAKGLTICRAII